MAQNKATKKPVQKSVSKPVAKKTTTRPVKKTFAAADLSGEQLVVENLSTLSSLVGTLSETLDVLVQKVENMAYHLIATEEVLAEVVNSTGLDLAKVNNRIRTKIAQGTNQQGDPSRAIDIAAGIASPQAQFKR